MRRFVSRYAALFTVLLVLPCCSASGPLFERRSPKPGQALVVIYRDWWNGNVFHTEVNGEETCYLHSNGFFPLDTKPGLLKLNVVRSITPPYLMAWLDSMSMTGKVLLELNARAGQTYYVRFDQGFGSVSMKLVPEEAALPALEGLRMTEDLRESSGG